MSTPIYIYDRSAIQTPLPIYHHSLQPKNLYSPSQQRYKSPPLKLLQLLQSTILIKTQQGKTKKIVFLQPTTQKIKRVIPRNQFQARHYSGTQG